MFDAMIKSGDLAKISGSSLKVFVAIIGLGDPISGHSSPRLEKIIEKSGVSRAQVQRDLNELEEMGYLTRRKDGRNNIYVFKRSAPVDKYESPF